MYKPNINLPEKKRKNFIIIMKAFIACNIMCYFYHYASKFEMGVLITHYYASILPSALKKVLESVPLNLAQNIFF